MSQTPRGNSSGKGFGGDSHHDGSQSARARRSGDGGGPPLAAREAFTDESGSGGGLPSIDAAAGSHGGLGRPPSPIVGGSAQRPTTTLPRARGSFRSNGGRDQRPTTSDGGGARTGMTIAAPEEGGSVGDGGEPQPPPSARSSTKKKRKKDAAEGLAAGLDAEMQLSEIKFQHRQVERLRKRFNELKHTREVREAEMLRLKDTLLDLEREEKANKKDRQLVARGHKQKVLEKKAEDLAKKLQDESAREQMLAYMEERGRREAAEMESELVRVKERLAVLEKQHQDAVVEARNMKNKRHVAESTLKQLTDEMITQQEDHRRRLEERELAAKETAVVVQLRDNMEQRRRKLVAKVKTGLVNRTEETTHKKERTTRVKQAEQSTKLAMEENMLNMYKRTYRKIFHATGSNDIELVVRRFEKQDKIRRDLLEMIEAADERIAKLNSSRGEADKQLSEIKFSGLGHLAKQREMLDEYDEKIQEHKVTVRRMEEQVSGVMAILTGVKQGVTHLVSRLSHIPLDPDAQGMHLNMERDRSGDPAQGITELTSIGDEDLPRGIAQCEWKILKMLDTFSVEELEEVDVLAEAPAEQKVMVPTEEQMAAILKKEAEDQEAAEAEELAELSDESDAYEETHPVGERENMKHMTAEIMKMAQRRRRKLTRAHKDKEEKGVALDSSVDEELSAEMRNALKNAKFGQPGFVDSSRALDVTGGRPRKPQRPSSGNRRRPKSRDGMSSTAPEAQGRRLRRGNSSFRKSPRRPPSRG